MDFYKEDIVVSASKLAYQKESNICYAKQWWNIFTFTVTDNFIEYAS